MTTHTPGPWKTRIHKDGDLIIGTLPDSTNLLAMPVARLQSDFAKDQQTNQANANLIEVAPELLQVVELTIKDLHMRAELVDGDSVVNLSNFIYLRLLTIRDKANGIIQI